VTTRGPEPTIVSDVHAVYRAAAELFVSTAIDAVDARGRFMVALAGGSTPRGLYSLLATDQRLRAQVPWEQCEFFWGDERHVPPEHPDSNYRMAWEAMLSRVPIRPERVHRVRAEEPDAARAADLYEAELRRTFPGDIAMPRFDLILLGLGADGHTASLFPGTGVLLEQTRLVAATRVESLGAERITMTYPLLNAARGVMFAAAGEEKARAVRDVLRPLPGAPDLPARLVQPTDGVLVWVIDRAAASLLDGVRGG
jgi:6-phosphogluconolactonase